MKKHLLLTIVLLIGVLPLAFAQKTKHVILISIDGLRPEFYLNPEWGMVNLREMMKNGIYAQGVNSVFPSVTYPNHTSMITGVRPEKHGIYFNNVFEKDHPTNGWNWYYDSIKSPTLWDIAKKSGITTASINWPVSVGAPVDYNIPVVKENGISRLDGARKYCKPAGLMQEIETMATGKLDNLDFAMTGDYLILDENIARIGAYLFRTYEPGLMTIHFTCVDHCEHLEGRQGPAVKRAVENVDRGIRSILESIDRAGMNENTTLIVTGDHGFVDVHTVLSPNVWLAQGGLIKNREDGEWEALFQAVGGSAFLMVKDSGNKKIIQEVRSIIESLPDNQKKLFHIIDKEQLIKAGANPEAALALTGVQGVAFSGSLKGEPVRSAKGGTHGYYPDFKEIQTGFVGFGPGLKKGVVIPTMEITDVAPIVLELLGITFPEVEGLAYPGIFTDK